MCVCIFWNPVPAGSEKGLGQRFWKQMNQQKKIKNQIINSKTSDSLVHY